MEVKAVAVMAGTEVVDRVSEASAAVAMAS